MTDSWHDSSRSPGAGTGSRAWNRRPRRSITDRKIAGVAGGLGRAFGVDPVLIRVAFVVLTIFGGFGGLLYVLGWLLLPADNDEVSAAEALLGRGRSSVAPVLAVGLGIVAVISILSMFSWGLPFWPVVIAGTIAVVVLRHRGRQCARNGGGSSSQKTWVSDSDPYQDRDSRTDARAERHARHWEERAERHARQWDARAERHARRWADRADHWAGKASTWGDQIDHWVAAQSQRGWGVPGSASGQSQSQTNAPSGAPNTSPFERPAFWDQQAAGPVGPADRGTRGTSAVNMTKDTPSEQPVADDPASLLDEHRTPPAWDPLGVAPFAWDLPDPTPVPEPGTARPPVRGRTVIGRVTIGLTLLAGGLAAAGTLAGWWFLTWAQVSAIALTVVALGLLLSAIRGRGYALAGPGIFLALVTMALTVTGLHGTDGFGDRVYSVSATTPLQPEYVLQAGDNTVDLTGLTVPAGETVSSFVRVGAGHAEIIVPAGVTTHVTCTAEVGQIDCLDMAAAGVRQQVQATNAGTAGNGTLELDVLVGAGYAEVRNG